MSDRWQRPDNVSAALNKGIAGKHCVRHDLFYDGPAGAPCPACQLLEELRKVQGEVGQLRAVNAKLIKENRALSGITDVKASLSGAARIMEVDDMLWIKEKLYEYKLTKKLILKTTHAPPGFIAQVAGQQPEAYACTSIGGAALASAYDEACSLHGAGRAMGLMADALWELLPGGHRDG